MDLKSVGVFLSWRNDWSATLYDVMMRQTLWNVVNDVPRLQTSAMQQKLSYKYISSNIIGRSPLYITLPL